MFEPAAIAFAARDADPVPLDAVMPKPMAAELTLAADVARRPDGMQDGFQIPTPIWNAMFACYGVFFVAIASATAWSGHARFAIAISILYALMYFGVARALAALAGPERQSPLVRKGGVLQTHCGPMDYKAVAGQILTVPACLAGFAIGIAIIAATVA